MRRLSTIPQRGVGVFPRGEMIVGQCFLLAYNQAEFWRSAVFAELQNRAHYGEMAPTERCASYHHVVSQVARVTPDK